MRTRTHGLLTRGVAAVVSTTLVGTTVLQGCTDGDQEVVEIRVTGNDLATDRTVVKVTYDDGETISTEIASADPMIEARPGRALVETSSYWDGFYVGRGSTVDDLTPGGGVDVVINQQATPFPAGAFASHVASPIHVGEGDLARFEIVLGPRLGPPPGGVSGRVRATGSFADLFPPVDVIYCPSNPAALCADVPVSWLGTVGVEVMLENGAQAATTTVPVTGVWSDVSTDRALRFEECLLRGDDGRYEPLPAQAEYLEYLGITWAQLAGMNLAIAATLTHDALYSPELMAAMLVMVAMQPAVQVGLVYFWGPLIRALIKLAKAIFDAVRARRAYQTYKAADAATRAVMRREAILTGVAAGLTIADGILAIEALMKVTQDEVDAELAKPEDLRDPEKLRELGEQLSEQRARLEDLLRQQAEAEQHLREAQAEEGAGQ